MLLHGPVLAVTVGHRTFLDKSLFCVTHRNIDPKLVCNKKVWVIFRPTLFHVHLCNVQILNFNCCQGVSLQLSQDFLLPIKRVNFMAR